LVSNDRNNPVAGVNSESIIRHVNKRLEMFDGRLDNMDSVEINITSNIRLRD